MRRGRVAVCANAVRGRLLARMGLQRLGHVGADSGDSALTAVDDIGNIPVAQRA